MGGILGALRRLGAWLARPRPRFAGLLAALGGLLVFTSLFFGYEADFDEWSITTVEVSLFSCTIALALLIGGGLLIRKAPRGRLVGATAVVVTGALFFSELVYKIMALFDNEFPIRPRAGFWLELSGYSLMAIAVPFAANACLRPLLSREAWVVRSRTRLLGLASFLGFATAVGFTINPVSDVDGAYGSPLDPAYPRELWGYVFVVIAVAVVPALAAIARDWAVTAGVTLGVLAFVVAWNISNLTYVYVDNPFGEKAIEGTWTFLAAGLATVLVLLACMGMDRRPRRNPRPGTAIRPRLVPAGAALAMVGAVLLFASLFPRFYSNDPFSRGGIPPFAVGQMVTVIGLILASTLVLSNRQRRVGVSALAVILVLTLADPVLEMVIIAEKDSLAPGVGFWLLEIGFGLAIAGAAVAATAQRRTAPRNAQLPPLRSSMLMLGAFLAVATSTALVMHTGHAFDLTSGSPLTGTEFDYPSSRHAWSVILAVVLIPVLTVVALRRNRQVALGITLGFLTVFVALIAARLLDAFFDGINHGIEGTWTFVSAAPALLLVLGYHLWRTAPRSRRAVA